MKPPPLKLATRLILLLVPLTVASMLFQAAASLRLEDQALALEAETRARSIAQQLAILSGQALATCNEWLLPQSVGTFGRLAGVVRVTVTDDRGLVLADLDRTRVGLEEKLAAGAAFRGPSRLGRTGHESVEVSVPVQGAGLVTVGVSLREARAALLASAWAVGWASLGLGLVATLVLWLLARRFTRPILSLAERARRVSEDLELVSEGGQAREVRDLELALELMCRRLRERTSEERGARERLQARVENLRCSAQQVAGGNLRARVPAQEDDDLGRLERGFNEMVSNLAQTRRAELQARLELNWTRETLERGNQHLRELDRRKTDFLNTASHELRTPLTSIRAFAEIMLENDDPSLDGPGFREANEEFLHIVDSESERLARMIGDMLDMSRIESGQLKWNFEVFDVLPWMRTAAANCRSLADENHLELRIDAPGELRVRADRDSLTRVLINLLSNAIKFTPAGGKVEARARTNGEQVILEVEDSGIGIAPEDQPKLFESFQQAEAGPEHKAPKGSGLGLAIVKQIVEGHGGTIKLVSQVGKGSTFIVRLPAVEDE